MPPLDPEGLNGLIRTVADRIIAASDELTALDRAIGDGDHGINMRRGMEAVLDGLDAKVPLAPGPALQAVGRQIVMSVGGASGPLFGTFFLALGKALAAQSGAGGRVEATALPAAFAAAFEAVKARGRSDEGQKTMLDVLGPVARALGRAAGAGEVLAVARDSAAATRPMRAERGRAAFLGDRSIGHLDPGARTVELMLEAVVMAVGRREAVGA